ncbi:MAG: efflux transporter outer membrane subunit [Geminicoccaceae bacterium]
MWANRFAGNIVPLASVIALMFLNACASLDRHQQADKGIEIPEGWQADHGSAASVADGWLQVLDIPGLQSLVAEALQVNADLRATAARFEQASWQASIERGTGAPELELALGAERNRSHQINERGKRDATYLNDHRLTLDVTWEMDVWGRIQANTEAANADLDAARQDYKAARLSLTAQTAQLVVDLSTARMQRDLAAKRVDSFEGTVQRVKSRYQRGLTTALDFHLAATDLATAEAELAERTDQLSKAARALEVLLGRYPADDMDGLQTLPRLRGDVPAGLPAALLERRPDLAAERARLLAAGYRVKAARAELLPRISLTASGGTQSEQFKNLFDTDFLIASIAANLVQPVFQGGQLRNKVKLSKAAEKETLSAYANGALTAFKEVEDALGAERWLERQEQALTEALKQADAAERIAKAQYERGLTQVLELLTAKRGRLDAADRLLDVRRQRINNRIALHLALGGDFAPAKNSRRTIETS